MGTQKITVLTLTIKSTGAIAKKRAVTYAGAQAGAAVAILGIADYGATAAGEYVTVDVQGTSIATSGAAVALGAALETDASGRLVTKSAGVTVARALEAATAADQNFEVLLLSN
jgi:hypothetical protein